MFVYVFMCMHVYMHGIYKSFCSSTLTRRMYRSKLAPYPIAIKHKGKAECMHSSLSLSLSLTHSLTHSLSLKDSLYSFYFHTCYLLNQ